MDNNYGKLLSGKGMLARPNNAPDPWKSYKRKGLSEMRPYIEGENVVILVDDELVHISISDVDRDNGSPKVGDMIARNPKNHKDQWLVAEKYFIENLELFNVPPGNLY
jgi:hypothetical protein